MAESLPSIDGNREQLLSCSNTRLFLEGLAYLMILPDAKLKNRESAVASVCKLAEIGGIEAVLMEDGWSIFRDGTQQLQELSAVL